MFLQNDPIAMNMPQLLKSHAPMNVYEAPLLITLSIKINWAMNNLTKIRPKCGPHSAPLFNAWFQSMQSSYPICQWCDLADAILGGVGAGTGFLNFIDIEALRNKASSIETLHSKITQGQEHQIAKMTQTNLNTIELQ